jgi:hypothetical protein
MSLIPRNKTVLMFSTEGHRKVITDLGVGVETVFYLSVIEWDILVWHVLSGSYR